MEFKFVISILALVAVLATTAKADTFTIIKNGKQYLCAPEPSDPGASIDCANLAYQGPFTRDEAEQLCSGAISTSPAKCARTAYNGPITKEQAIRLCQRATTDTGPTDCAKKVFNGPFTLEQAIQLCSNDGNVDRADCAIKAYAGAYTQDQAIQLCRGNTSVLNELVKKKSAKSQIKK